MKKRTEAPESLTAEERAALDDWALRKEPWCLPVLDDLVETCLDHHRACGKPMADWVACVRTWVRKERQFYGRRRVHAPAGGNRGLAGAAQLLFERVEKDIH